METKEFQQKCAKIVKDLDEKYNVNRNPHLGFAQFIEEVGELAKEINKPKIRNKEIDSENLKGEFADVFLQLYALADILGVNVEDAVNFKSKILEERHGLKF